MWRGTQALVVAIVLLVGLWGAPAAGRRKRSRFS